MKRNFIIFTALVLLTANQLKELNVKALMPRTFAPQTLDHIIPVWQDKTYERMIIADIASDPTGTPMIITRLLHNKVTAIMRQSFISLARPLDPSFVFSFPGPLSVYDNYFKPQMLFPAELLLVIYAIFSLVSRPSLLNDNHVKLSLGLGIALMLFLAATSPVIHPIKLLLIGIAIRYIYLSVLSLII